MKKNPYWLPTLGLLALGCLHAQTSAGNVRFIRQATSSLDSYTNSPTTTQQQWFQTHFWRMTVYSPYFDSKLSWYPNADFYKDLYAIYVNDPLATQHPEWILRDASGHKLYIPWGCSNGACPQYAADVSNPAFRQWWINEANTHMALGYHGVFVDDVNMEFRVGDGNGNFVAPIDPTTGAAMTYSNWRLYVAQFCEAIRAAFPGKEIIHNSIWYANSLNDSDAYVQRQIAAGDYQNIEFGVNDSGLTGGTGSWSLNALLTHIDHVHAANRSVMIAGVPVSAPDEEYALANYYLVSNGADAIGSVDITPANWWTGYDTVLGSPSAGRYTWNNLLRRDFSGGIALVNPPQSATVTVTLPKTYRRLDGSSVTSVTLGAKQGAVLTDPNPTAPPPPGTGLTCPGPASGAFTGCYYSDETLTKLALVRTDAAVNFNWGAGSPGSTVPSDSFSAKWEGVFNFNAGNYTFKVTADDGVRLYIDGTLVLDKWILEAPTTYQVGQNLTAGSHTIKLTYFEHTGGAVAQLSWTGSTNALACPGPAARAFTGCYYKDETLSTLALVRTDSAINFDWGYGSPAASLPADYFSAKWEGAFNFNAANYTFKVTADDGVRVYIDGGLVLDKWILQAATTYTFVRSMTAGTHTIRMTYFEHTGQAVAKLSWR